MTRLLVVIGFVFSIVTASSAQVITAGTSGKCGKIYNANDLAHRARLIDFKSLTLPKEASENGVKGQVIINAVLCRNGRVTDITVVKGLPFGVTESAIFAVLNTRFAPAELNFHSVSQTMQFQFSVNESGTSGTVSTNAAVRLIEEVDVIGNRRMTKEKVLEWIKSQPGAVYQAEQVQQDLSSLLRSGYFNPLNSRVTVENAPRGGVRVSFEVSELPLITQIAFDGYKPREDFIPNVPDRQYDVSPILNGLARQQVDVRVGKPLDAANLKKATKVIEDYLRSRGWINVKVEAVVEYLVVPGVKITFRIRGSHF